MAEAAQRPTDIQYKRYMTLVHRFRQNGYRLANFAVYDPFFTTLTILAERKLAEIAEDLKFESQAKERAERLLQGLESRLWSPELKRYRYFDAISQRFEETYTSGSLSPVILGEEIKGYDALLYALRSDFLREGGVPTVAPSSESYDPVCYWRGPIWVNMNWLFSHADETIRQKTLALVDKEGFWEYFNPENGKGLGADQFTWTAALVLDLLSNEEFLV